MANAAADAVENGWTRIQELLQTPEDLATIEQMRARIAADKASKDAALKAVVRTQLESVLAVKSLLGTPVTSKSSPAAAAAAAETATGSQKTGNSELNTQKETKTPAKKPEEVAGARGRRGTGAGGAGGEVVVVDSLAMQGMAVSTLAGMQENLRAIDLQVQTAQRLIPHYHLLRVLFYSQRQLHNALELSSALTALPDRIYELRKLVREESNDALRGRNLLRIHKELFELEALRDTTLASSNASASNAILMLLGTHFASVDEISSVFQRRLWFLAKNLLTLVKAKNHGTIVTLLKVVEVEERADLLAAEGKPRTVKHAKERLLEEMAQAVADQFGRFVGGGEEDALAKALGDTDFIQEHLTVVYDDLVPSFPPSYGVFDFYLEAYHRNVTEMLDRFLANRLSPLDILTLFRWVDDYYRGLRERLGIQETSLTPQLLPTAQRDRLNGDYLQMVRDRAGEWARNIMITEAREFRARREPPETEDGGKYGTSGPVILFKMLNQQIDVARAATDGRLLAHLSAEIHTILAEFQRKYEELAEEEGRRYLDYVMNPPAPKENPEDDDQEGKQGGDQAQEDEVPGGLVEYLMAAINVQYKCSEFTMQLTDRFKAELRLGDYIQEIEERLTLAENGFRNAGKKIIAVLLSVAFFDLTPVFQDLFTLRWLEGSGGRLLMDATATLGDYCRDFQTHLQGFFFNRLMYECLDRLLQAYIEAMFSKGSSFRQRAEVGRAMDADIKEIGDFFSNGYLIESRVLKTLTVLRDLRVLLTSEATGIPAAIESIKERNPDVQATQIDKLLQKRGDLNKDAIARGLEAAGLSTKVTPPVVAAGAGALAAEPPKEGHFSKVAASLAAQGKKK